MFFCCFFLAVGKGVLSQRTGVAGWCWVYPINSLSRYKLNISTPLKKKKEKNQPRKRSRSKRKKQMQLLTLSYDIATLQFVE